MEAGLYIHIPFCSHHCGYCGFAVSARHKNESEFHARYVSALLDELRLQKRRYPNLQFSTLYIGGGTPSQLVLPQINALFRGLHELIDASGLQEVTFECNPEDIVRCPDLPGTLAQWGVTRMSVGLQTLSNSGLKVLERSSTLDTMYSAPQHLGNNWVGRSLSYDLMIGWPGQTLTEFVDKDLGFLRQQRFDHISLYILNYEKGTRLERDRRRNRVTPLDDDTGTDIWQCWLQAAASMGLLHYEISNFGREGHKSIHNRNIWRGMPYLGLGTGAVSRIGRVRWTNPATPELYLKKMSHGRPPAASAEYLTDELSWQEDLFLRMRFEEGLDPLVFENQHHVNPQAALGRHILEWREAGWLYPDRLAFTSKGWTLFDALISDWMLLIEKNQRP